MLGTHKFLLLAAAALIMTPAVAALADSFSFSQIVVPNSTAIYVNGIWNNEAVGQFYTSKTSGAFVWSNGSASAEPAYGKFAGVSPSGLALGILEKGNYTYSTFDLTTGDQANFTIASQGQFTPQSINSSGIVAGIAELPTGKGGQKQQIFEYDPNGTLTLLGQKTKSYKHYNAWIDDTGFIVSSGVDCIIYKNGHAKTFRINGTSPDCATVPVNGQFGGEYAINNGSIAYGFLSTGNHHYTTIEVPGAPYTVVSALNSKGEVVGDYEDTNRVEHGFLYVNGTYYTIDYPNSGGGSITGISETGSIVGYYGDRLPFIAVCSSENGICTQ